MSNCNKIKQKCGVYVYATCTKYEGTLSEHSSLEEGCLDIEQVAEDIYSLIDTIKEDTDVSTLENTCISFTEPKTPSSVISQMCEEMCLMKTLIESQTTLIEDLTERVTNLEANVCP